MIAAALIAATLGTAQLSPVAGALYAKPHAPIRATLSGVTESCELALLDPKGTVLARGLAEPGEIDLASILPSIVAAQRAVRVQCVVNGVPEGAPLLVTPLKVRPTIRLATEMRPDGKTPFTRIIGWGGELLDPANPEHKKLQQAWAPEDPAPQCGFRVDLDRDVVFETTAGKIRFAMRPDEAPATARNFVQLAADGFYDGTIVHRVVPKGRTGLPFVIQGGDPAGTGDGGPGYDIPIEPSRLPHDFGVLSMARNDWPDSAGSQWFVALTRAETARLDGQYCAFGYAVEGAEAIVEIEKGEIKDEKTGMPVKPVVVTHATAVPAPAWTPGKGRPDSPVKRPAAK